MRLMVFLGLLLSNVALAIKLFPDFTLIWLQIG